MSSTSKEITVIKAGDRRQLFKPLIKYHELLFFLSWRDILVRYKQTVLGILWAVIRPFIVMVVFTLLFGKALNLEEKSDVPYPLIIFAALLPWQFFTSSVQQVSDSFVQNQGIISKVYFPRLIIPLSSMMTSAVDFLISSLILILLMVWFNYIPTHRVLYLIAFIFILLVLSLGMGIFFASFNVTYRDFKYIIPFLLQIAFYISPVGYNISVIPEQWQFFYSLNPMVGIIEGFRWCLLVSYDDIYLPSIFISIIFSLFFFLIGLKIFFSMERNFADKI